MKDESKLASIDIHIAFIAESRGKKREKFIKKTNKEKKSGKYIHKEGKK